MFWSLWRSAARPSWYALRKLPSSRLTWARLEHRMELSAASPHPACAWQAQPGVGRCSACLRARNTLRKQVPLQLLVAGARSSRLPRSALPRAGRVPLPPAPPAPHLEALAILLDGLAQVELLFGPQTRLQRIVALVLQGTGQCPGAKRVEPLSSTDGQRAGAPHERRRVCGGTAGRTHAAQRAALAAPAAWAAAAAHRAHLEALSRLLGRGLV